MNKLANWLAKTICVMLVIYIGVAAYSFAEVAMNGGFRLAYATIVYGDDAGTNYLNEVLP